MKLCRFERVDDPGTARSGFAYDGRIIETDGTQAIETYAGSDIRLLAPIGRPYSVRLFGLGATDFEYVHPSAMFGPNQDLLKLSPEARLRYVPCLAVVLVGRAAQVPIRSADDLIMGLAFAHMFTYAMESGGRAVDPGFALGPALVTPDEFEGGSIRPENGASYADTVTLLQNSVEVARFELDGLSPTIAQLIAHASTTQPVMEGDVLLIPLGDPEAEVEHGDELRLTSERMGTLIVRVGNRMILPACLLLVAQQSVAARAQTLAAEYLETAKIAGVSIAAVQDGKLIFALGAGFSNMKSGQPVRPETLMRLGSVSKSITAIAALSLVEQGKLDLDKPITTYVPEWPKDKPVITLRQLLTHTAGVRHYNQGPDPTGATFRTYTTAEALSLFSADPLKYPPGTAQVYSTHAFTVVARAIETSSKRSIVDYLRRRIFKDGKGELDCEVAADSKPKRSELYASDGKTITAYSRREDNSWKYGGGGMEATARGLAFWGDALRSGKIIKPATRDMAWTVAKLKVPNTQSYGLGWRVDGDVVSHGGAQQGCRSQFTINRAKKLTVVVLTNTSGTHAPAQLADRLIALFP